jgi:beta-lactamase regulating signal transducer with metallopeptidase domain
MTSALLDHIWQSSLFAGAAGLLTLAFRRNGAALRFWLWFAASLKFLVPFAGLAALGEYLARQFPASLPQSIIAIQPAAEKLSAPARTLVAPQVQTLNLVPLLLGLWLTGFVALLALRLLRWSRLRAMMAQARDLAIFGSVRVMSSPSLLEPGLVGILEPAVLMPTGLMPLLSDAERDSILAHEFSHLSRRDNFTAAIHMTVEALFWFYPPVWLIGSRLIAERERACDESVLASGHDPEVYAGGILKVCKFCIQSPLACVSGVSGADLGMRVRMIMTGEAARDVGAAKRLLLAGACAFTLAMPVMAGFMDSPLALRVQRDVMAVQRRAALAVTVMAEQIGVAPLSHITAAPLPRLKMKIASAPPVLPAMETAFPAPLPSAATPPPAASVTAPQPLEQPVAPAVPAPAAKEAVTVLDPRGEGDPDSMTCRAPQALPESRLPGPKVCKTNRLWAQLRADGQVIAPDGTIRTLSRNGMTGCSRAALLGALPSQNIPDGSVLSGCR